MVAGRPLQCKCECGTSPTETPLIGVLIVETPQPRGLGLQWDSRECEDSFASPHMTLAHPSVARIILLESVGTKRENSVCGQVEGAYEARCYLLDGRPWTVIYVERARCIPPRVSE